MDNSVADLFTNSEDSLLCELFEAFEIETLGLIDTQGENSFHHNNVKKVNKWRVEKKLTKKISKLDALGKSFINVLNKLCPSDYIEIVSFQSLNELEPHELLNVRLVLVSNKTLRWVTFETYQWMIKNYKNAITNEKLSKNGKKLLNKLDEVKKMIISDLKKSENEENLMKKINQHLLDININL